MKKTILALGLLLSLSSFAQQPPKAPSKPVIDNYFGKTVVDKYRNLEDLKNEETLNWMKSQANYTNSVLNSIPGKQGLINILSDIDSRRTESIFGLQILDDGTYFYQKTTPKDQIAKLFKRKGIKGKETLVFDPEKFENNNKDIKTISSFSPNKLGTIISINLSKNGGEMSEMILLDLTNDKILPERIDKLRFGGATWLKDDKSFIYSQSPTSDVLDVKAQSDLLTKHHVIGNPISNDKLIFSKGLYPEINFTTEELPFFGYDIENDIFICMPYTVDPNLKIYMSKNTNLGIEKFKWKLLFDRKDEIRTCLIKKNELFVMTALNAPNFKLLRVDLNNIDFSKAKTIIPEDNQFKLTSFNFSKKGILYTTDKNGIESKLYFTYFDGTNTKEILTPKKSATISVTTSGLKNNDIWISTSGWISPSERYKFDINKNLFEREELSTKINYPEFENLEVQELMIKSHDGVEVPLSLIYKKGIKKDGNTPTLFYGYGAYGWSMSPAFDPGNLLWVNKGGILAIAHVRGGGELGKNWHMAGYKTTKPNTWKDVIACTEYMINEGYTNPTKTAIYSRSAGGIFVGRAITERPDLYAVAIPGVGSMNTVRAENTPNGPANIAEFGTMGKEYEAKALIEMDSYLNLKENTKYPATLTTAGFNDSRIIVWEPAKFAARILDVNISNKPNLLKVDYEAGHFGGATKAKSFEEIADVLSFALWQVGHNEFQPKK